MNINNHIPLAMKIRPQSLEEFFGQEELLGENSFFQNAIEGDKIPSMIFWGPPGTGKTTLASIIAKKTKSDFLELSAVQAGIKDLKIIIERGETNKRLGIKTILFIDEIHRWNKKQQDALLPHVENGTLVLIGATTENPSFEVNSALLSRTRTFILKKLEPKDLVKILERALSNKEKGLAELNLKLEDKVLHLIAYLANGDARTALNILEAAASQDKNITPELVKQIVQKSNLFYDKNGEEHYNIISALHKSMRGHEPDASLYWLARMLEGGEDPIYVARRLVRFASEDIGLADNNAVILANTVFDVCKKLGMPECNTALAQLVIYLAKAPKSVDAYNGYNKAKSDVEKYGNLPVPLHIRNAPTKLMKDLGYGKDYKYTPKQDSSDQEYFPDELKNKKYI